MMFIDVESRKEVLRFPTMSENQGLGGVAG